MRGILLTAVAAAALMSTAGSAMAAVTVLTFNTGELACSAVQGGATSKACATSGQGPDPDFIGTNYGGTPALAVSYDASEPTGSRTSLHFNTAFGGVATAFPQGEEASKIFFTPAAGFEVSFRSFDWHRLTATFTSYGFRVLDPQGNQLFSATHNGTLAGNAGGSFAPQTAYFAGPLTFEFTNGGSGAVGVDNVTVDVRGVAVAAVPEPTAWAMMILGFGAAGAVLRRRRMLPA